MGRSPAFSFYPNDWLSSGRIAVMSPEEEGAYIRLLCYAWNDPDCSIPDDDFQLAALSRLGDRWNVCSTHVRACFAQHPKREGRLYNERLFQERQKQNERSLQNRAAGIRSGEARRCEHGKPTNERSTSVQRKANLSSSSSSSVSIKDSPNGESCGETGSPPPVMEFPCKGKGKKKWGLSVAKLAEYRESYPDLDVLAEARAARQWCIDNASKRKTYSGMMAFLTRWFNRAQNEGRGGRGKTNEAPKAERPLVDIKALMGISK